MFAGAVVVVLVLIGTAALAGASVGAPDRTIAGPVIAAGNGWVTVQTAGRRTGTINALTEAADKLTQEDYPYVWGGGHGEAGVASLGIKGPGYNGRTHGYDCSGAVAAVLAGAGLWTPGASVPADAGVIQELLTEHLIARGVGAAPDAVTLYDDPGVHIFMNIDGRFFGTSDGGVGGDSRGGAGWLEDGAWDASSRAFRKYHFLPSVLAQKTTYGDDFTFDLPTALADSDGVAVGDRLSVGYSAQPTGAMLADTLTFTGARTISGVLGAVSAAGVTLTTAAGRTATISVGGAAFLLDGLQGGDTVSVLYTDTEAGAVAHTITVTAQPVVTTPTVTPPAPAPPSVTTPPPSVTVPGITVPGVTTPGVTTPGVTTPGVTTPTVTVPGV